jgi:tyrosine-protein phosphatase YwqE
MSDPLLRVDMHSHILPAFDDGAKTLEESVDLLRAMQGLGYKKLIVTPHIMCDAYGITPRRIEEALENLREIASKEKIDIVLEAAAEYYLDDDFLKWLREDKILSFGANYILIETSYLAQPINFLETISEIIACGYKPVLAHPERYQYLEKNVDCYQELKNANILFQVNLGSLGGYYGKEAKEKALMLYKEGMIDFLGSDLHRSTQVKSLQTLWYSRLLSKVVQKNRILNNTV